MELKFTRGLDGGSWKDHVSAQFTDSDMVRRGGSPPPPTYITPLGAVIQDLPDSLFEPFGNAEFGKDGGPAGGPEGFRRSGEHFVNIAMGASETFYIMDFHFVAPGLGSLEAVVTVRSEVWRAPEVPGPTDVPRSNANRVRALLLYIESENYVGWGHI